jgi:hypothetical protein
MIPGGVEIFVALAPIDLRWGFDRLAGVVQEQVGRPEPSGALFVFFGKRKSALKILFFDGSGLCLFYKRLDHHTFRVPSPFQPPPPGRNPRNRSKLRNFTPPQEIWTPFESSTGAGEHEPSHP